MSDCPCPVHVTQEDYDEFKKHEAVVIVEYEREDGTRFGRIEAWGDLSEMEDQAATPRLVVIPVGLKLVCQKAVPVMFLF